MKRQVTVNGASRFNSVDVDSIRLIADTLQSAFDQIDTLNDATYQAMDGEYFADQIDTLIREVRHAESEARRFKNMED